MNIAAGVLFALLAITGFLIVDSRDTSNEFIATPPVVILPSPTPTRIPLPTRAPTVKPKPVQKVYVAPTNAPVVVANQNNQQQVLCHLGPTNEVRNISECPVPCYLSTGVSYYPSVDGCNAARALYNDIKNTKVDPIPYTPPPSSVLPTVYNPGTTFTYDPLPQINVQPSPTIPFPPIGFHN